MRTFLFGFAGGLLVAVALGVGGLVALGHAMSPSDPLAKADAIVAISGDNGPRVATAVELWKQGYAPTVIFAGASLDPQSPSSAELMARQAVALGLPRERILLEPRSATTDQNAVNVAQLMRERGMRTAILVTSPYHQRRAALAFGRELGLEFRNHPADDPAWDPTTWWLHADSRAITVLEFAKLSVEEGWIRLP